MKRFIRIILLLVLLVPARVVRADEGMWLPVLLSMLNEADMKAKGFKLTAADIYSINQVCIKDAVVIFGGGCTGEIISKNGLLLTNHHCGFSQIQSHSSVENDLLTKGFWAMSPAEELPNPGLTVQFLVRMEDVTAQVLEGTAGASGDALKQLIDANMTLVEKNAVAGTGYEAGVESFFYGNQYFLMVYQTYSDVRLVGAPPSAIGKFGGETDNWVWPRHNADFSLFRVYASPDGAPAPYSPDNQPLKPKYHLPISMKGVKEGDFTMVLGFPGSTQEYLSSYAVAMTLDVLNPIRVELREVRLAVMNAEMRKSDAVRIQYASKDARISNAYKKWKGEMLGLKRTGAIAKKEAYEAAFNQKLEGNPEWKAAYGDILPRMKTLYADLGPVIHAQQLFLEGGISVEAVQLANTLNAHFSKNQAGPPKDTEKLLANLDRFYKNYHAPIDQATLAVVLEKYAQRLPAEWMPEVLKGLAVTWQGNWEGCAADMFARTSLVNKEVVTGWVRDNQSEALIADPLYSLMIGLYSNYFERIAPDYNRINSEIQTLQQRYMTAQQTVFSDKVFYPDANFTMRVTYGQVQGYEPADGVRYNYYTTLGGAVEKNEHNPGNEDFEIPDQLVDLYRAGDFGEYAHEGEMRTCFVASNHTSGGNSGSPVLNAEGQLIGLNFDRGWEGTMSDISYDVRLCRNISVDIRYVLFIVDKYAGAGYLLEEMTLVR